ncbi:MAG: hypothetical protein A2X05_16850 [Bacteroidetes bacterium GWE2_41_25]|nr:MAG: hypothetical protein A2X03_19175 [Bacteroidetes bacterium GWA2_40_15]OFX86747.1 MAG: hypothetical protein A2X06_17805 [Bacteroidetes bacterium GWC2_40_22]OFY06933.1 MAG: hypothetical protein A2X05_16850 [Bacteroidetes bacterium GWE2_41_25]OFY56668.1 MAG: hypothetical protein A2X04_10790 [Bacteroidetes bacterium GWF2_41_9]HBH85956.1 hypothetical protein [Bacteroidales bacterium]
MLLRFFKGTSPGVILLISVIFITVSLSSFIHHAPGIQYSYSVYQMPLYGLLMDILGSGRFLPDMLSFLIAAFLLFLIVNFNTTIFFINERTFLPALLFILIIGVFPEYQKLNPAIPASLLFIIALKRIMAGYHQQGIAYNFFDAGILISTGSLFYANLLWFGVIIIIGIVLLRTVTVFELVISLLGLVTPYLITFGLYYVLGYDLDALASLIYNNIFSDSRDYLFPRLTIVTLIFEAIIVLLSVGFIMMLQNTKKIKSRKTFSLLTWVFVISLAVYSGVPSVSTEMIWITAIPVSYFLSHYFILSKKKLVSEIFFTILLVLILLIQVLYIFL